MKCPVCKKTIPNDVLRCPHCSARVGIICKNCHTLNSRSALVCKVCGEDVMKLCPNCGCVNSPNMNECSRCGHEFESALSAKKIKSTKQAKTFSQSGKIINPQEAEKLLSDLMVDKSKKIISLSGVRGVGKSYLLNKIIKNLQDKNFVWFYGKATALTQMTPGGLLQDIIFNLYELPNFCLNSASFRKDMTKLFQSKFPYLDSSEISDFINFLYPTKLGFFEELSDRKSKTFEILNKIFDNIIIYSEFVIVIDNLSAIDGLSYEFLFNYIKKPSVLKSLKLLLIYSETKPAQSFFNVTQPENYFDVRITPLSRNMAYSIIAQEIERASEFPKMDEDVQNLIWTQSKGNPAYIEQACGLWLDSLIADCKYELPENYDSLVAKRICLLSAINSDAYHFMMGCAILGDKINLNLVKQIFGYDENTFNGIITYLTNMNFIVYLNEIFYQFKDLLLWETIINIAKNDDEYIRLNTKVCNSLGNYTPNTNAIFGIIAQNIKSPKLALDIWTKTTRLAAYIGDLSLYAMAQKQSLALINELDEVSTLKVRYSISEKLGRLLTDFNPAEAMDYLPDAIANAKTMNDIPKSIDLLSCMTKCCEKTGAYFGNIECVESVLEFIPKDKVLEIALVKCSKLKSLLAIGNCGQIINLIDNEILPVLGEILKKSDYRREDIPIEFVAETFLKVYLILAEALVLQGNSRAFEVLNYLFDTMAKNSVQDTDFICKCRLTLAQANSIKGDYAASEKLLNEIIEQSDSEAISEECVLKWNFVNIFNNFMRFKFKDMQEELFEIVMSADNLGDDFTKNIMKTMLGNLFKHQGKLAEAGKIYNEQIAYFSKEKMAFGALLTWYLIADATLLKEGPYTAKDIAEQALDVAQNPKIDNYFFGVLLRIVLAKSFIGISDYESAKMYLEEAIKIAQKYGMNDLLSRLYLLYGKCLHDLGLNTSEEQIKYLKSSAKMYDMATKLVRQTKNTSVLVKIEDAKRSLHRFLATNNITFG